MNIQLYHLKLEIFIKKSSTLFAKLSLSIKHGRNETNSKLSPMFSR